MSEAIAICSLVAWPTTYLWLRSSCSARSLLLRYGCTLALPILGIGAAAVLRGAWLSVALDLAAVVLVLMALSRLSKLRP